MCGGFTCSKNALMALNILYIVVAFFLVGVAAYWETGGVVPSLPIVGGIIACGVFLLIVAIVGLLGAIKHHQVLLFFYMVVLFLLFLVQFSVACACLGVSQEMQVELARKGWHSVDNYTRGSAQRTIGCCGFSTWKIGENDTLTDLGHPSCNDVKKCCDGISEDKCCNAYSDSRCLCSYCLNEIRDSIGVAFKVVGGIGLFFSFTEFLGVWLTVRYRNQKDPRGHPSAFL